MDSGAISTIKFPGKNIESLTWKSSQSKGSLNEKQRKLKTFTITPQGIIEKSARELLATKKFINKTPEDIKVKISSSYLDPVFFIVPAATVETAKANLDETNGVNVQGINKIKNAYYYIKRLYPAFDVTQNFDYILKSNDMRMIVRSDLLGGDPAPGMPKKLLIEYFNIRTNQPEQLWFDEGQQVSFGSEYNNMANRHVYYGALQDIEAYDVTQKAKDLVKRGRLVIPAGTSLNTLFGPLLGKHMYATIDYQYEKPTEKVVSYYGPATQIVYQAKDKSFSGSIDLTALHNENVYTIEEHAYTSSNESLTPTTALIPIEMPIHQEEL